MPRSPDPEIRQRILDTATRLFYARGIQAVGMAQLVEEAGCGKSAMYREFPTKDALVLAYLEQFADRLAARQQRATAGLEDDPAATLRAIVAGVATNGVRPEFRGCPFRNYLREFPHPTSDPGRYAEAWLAGARQQVRDLVTATGAEDAELVADQVWLALDGLWSSAPYADRAALGAAAVALVDRLVPA